MVQLTTREKARKQYDAARSEFQAQEVARQKQYDEIRLTFTNRESERRERLNQARISFENEMDSIAERYSYMRKSLNEGIIKASSQDSREQIQQELRELTERYHQMQEVLETRWRDQRREFELERETDLANWDRVESHFLLVKKSMEDKLSRAQELYWEATDD